MLEVERERKEKEDREKEEREKKKKEEHEKAAQEAGSFNIFGPVFSLLTPEEPEAKKKRSSFTELANADEAKLEKIFKKIDADDSKTIDINEFKSFIKQAQDAESLADLGISDSTNDAENAEKQMAASKKKLKMH